MSNFRSLRKLLKDHWKRNRIGLSANYWRVFAATTLSSIGSGISSVALPWIASSLTRDPLAISLVALAGQLPWIIFTLHAGVLIDRLDKKRILITMDVARGVLTFLIALLVLLNQNLLGGVTRVNLNLSDTKWPLLILIIAAQLTMGFATVLADTTSQAVIPSVASKDQLTHANGRIWATISVSEQFIGPPIGSFLLGIASFLPLVFDATSFFLSAGLILLVTAQIGSKREYSENSPKPTFMADIKEGFNWLWSRSIFKTLALSLGAINLVNGLSTGIYIFYAQEILRTSVFQFALLGTGFAIGGVIGGILGPRLANKLGESKSLSISMIGTAITSFITGITSNWLIVWTVGIFVAVLITLWNIVTVSFRQSVIPTEIFGRVNSVYRFFGTGGAPIGSLLGALIVSLFMNFVSREVSLRAPFIISAAVTILIFAVTRNSLSREEFAKAKSEKLSN